MIAESWKSPEDWYQTNIVSQVKLYNSLIKLKFIKKMIHITTPEVFGSNNKKLGKMPISILILHTLFQEQL